MGLLVVLDVIAIVAGYLRHDSNALALLSSTCHRWHRGAGMALAEANGYAETLQFSSKGALRGRRRLQVSNRWLMGTIAFCKIGLDTGADGLLRRLPRYPTLKAIDASQSSVTNDGIRNLVLRGGRCADGSRPTLETLRLNGCADVSNAALRLLSGLSALTELSLSSTAVDDRSVQALSTPALVHLRVLDLGWCRRLSSAAFTALSQLPALQSLDLTECTGIGDEALRYIGQVAGLERLKLNWCGPNVTSVGVAYLASLPRLKELSVNGCKDLGEEGVASIALIPALKTFHAACVPLYASLGRSFAASPTRSLRHLHTPTGTLTDADLQALHQVPLETLEATGCNQLTDAAMAEFILAHEASLRILILFRWMKLGPATLAAVSGDGVAVVELDIGGCSALTDQLLPTLSRGVALRQLGLSYSPETLTDAGLQRLISEGSFPMLRHVNLSGSAGVTKALLQQLAG